MLTARWSGCSGSCTLLVSHRIDSYDMSTLPWRCFDFCVVDRLDAMPWVQLVPKKHGSSLLRWCKDFIKNGSSLLLHVRFAAVALLFASEKKITNCLVDELCLCHEVCQQAAGQPSRCPPLGTCLRQLRIWGTRFSQEKCECLVIWWILEWVH